MNNDESRSLSQYYAEVGRNSVIRNAQEERDLILKWKDHKDKASRDRLIQGHLRFVIQIARKLTRDPDRLQELIAAGNIGLLKAIERFDVSKNLRFLTYAAWWIRKEIYEEDYGNTLTHVPVHRIKSMRRDVKEGRTVAGIPAGGQAVPLDSLDESSRAHLEGTMDVDDDHDLSERSRKELIRKAIATLPPREQTVLNCYFGMKDDPRTLVQIADLLWISAERARQLKIRAMGQLQDRLVAMRGQLEETAGAP